MDKLKAIVKEYGRWSGLEIYIGRIEKETDFSSSVENAKALLETVGKEICSYNAVELDTKANINRVLKKAFSSMGYSSNNMVAQVSSALATIGQQLGTLRNEIGSTSHGRTMDQLKDRNTGIDELTKEFLIDTTELVSCFLIRNFENENPRKHQESQTEMLDYDEAETFNESWDDSFGEFVMGDYSYPASEILFNVDKQAYVNEYKAFTEAEE